MRKFISLLFIFLALSAYSQTDIDSIDVTVKLVDSKVIEGRIKNPNLSDWSSVSRLKIKTDEGKVITVRPKSTINITLYCDGSENVYIPIIDKYGDRFVRVYLFGEILVLNEDYRYCNGGLSTPKKSTCLWTLRFKSFYLEKNGVLSKRIKKCNYKKIIKPYVCDKPLICNMLKKGRYKYKTIDELIAEYNAH